MAEGDVGVRAALDKDKLLVSDSTNLSFTGFVSAHNELVTTYGETRQLAVSVEQDLTRTKQGIQETTTKHEERMTSLEARLEEMQRQNQELHESLKAHVEESLKTSEERLSTALKEHEESTTTKVKTLELSVEDAFVKIQTSNQSQLRMRAELDRELEKLSAMLEKSSAASAADLARIKSELITEQTKRLDEVNNTLVAKRDFEDLLAKFNNSDAQLAALTKYSEGVEERRLALEKDTKEKLEALWSRVQPFVQSETRRMLEEVKETLGKTLEQLELVVKRMDYERLAFEGMARQDIDALVRDMKAAVQGTKSQGSKLTEDFQGMLNQGIDGVKSNFNNRVAKMEETYLSLKGQVTQVSTSVTKTREELESAKRMLTETAKTEAGKVLTTVSKDQDGRFNELATSMKTIGIKHHGFAEQVARDLAATRQMVSTSFDEVGKKFETIAAAENRTEPLKQALHELVQELEEVTREQKRTDDAVNLVSVQLNDFEDKIMGGGFYIGPVAPLETRASSSRFSRPSSAYGREKGTRPMKVTTPLASRPGTQGPHQGPHQGLHKGPHGGPHHGPWLPTSPRPGTAREGAYEKPGPASPSRMTFEQDSSTGAVVGSFPRIR